MHACHAHLVGVDTEQKHNVSHHPLIHVDGCFRERSIIAEELPHRHRHGGSDLHNAAVVLKVELVVPPTAHFQVQRIVLRHMGVGARRRRVGDAGRIR